MSASLGLSFSCLPSYDIWSGMLCPPPLSRLWDPGQLVWHAVSALSSILSSTGKAEARKQKSKVHVRFLELFGVYGCLWSMDVYGGVIFAAGQCRELFDAFAKCEWKFQNAC